MFVIGTAGHVDHGKSTLVEALTGINPDRLAEEQAREMTIDLGFAWLTLPSGREVSIVDVPGHEHFVRNMLAGIGGVDLGLLVVAVDEAVMPQTREHLAILDLLRVPCGVIALTKCDLIKDKDWIDLVREEVREQLAGTLFEDAPIVGVSALSGEGLDKLVQVLDEQLAMIPPRADLERPRMPIDRAFAIAGFGAVATGTLLDGSLNVGDDVLILPDRVSARIRGMQTHKNKIEKALPGTRVAVNLSGVSVHQLRRGQVIAYPGEYRSTRLVDLRLRALPDSPWPLRHNMEVEFFSGAARTPARLRLLEADEFQPGAIGWAQGQLEQPLVLARGDRFVVRLLSPSVTLGGGLVVRPFPRRRHKRFRQDVFQELETLADGDPSAVLLHLLNSGEAASVGKLAQLASLPENQVLATLGAMAETGLVIDLTLRPDAGLIGDASILISTEMWERLMQRSREILGTYHRGHPLRLGMPREELRNRLRLAERRFDLVISRAAVLSKLHARSAVVCLPEYEVLLSADQENRVGAIVEEMRARGSTPPPLGHIERTLGPELVQYLVDVGRMVRVSDSVIFDGATYAEIVDKVVQYVQQHGQVTVAECRDLLNTSRRYAMGLLEHLDRTNVTKRIGDVRVLRRQGN